MPHAMRITVRFFAMLRDAADGQDAVDIDVADDATVAQALADLIRRWPRLDAPLKRSATAVNRAFANRDDMLHDGDELALIPPVSGG